MNSPSWMFIKSFGRYFNDVEFSDAVIECEGHEFHVHRVILAAHSPVFQKAFSSNWKERSEDRMTIDDKAPVIEAVLTYMYNFNYDNGTLIESRAPQMVFHAQVYAMAEMYGIQSLKEYSKRMFESSIAVGWKLEAFPSSITEAFSTTTDTDRGLRDPIIKVSCENAKALMVDNAFKVVLRQTPGFAADFAEALVKGDNVVLKECTLTAYKSPCCQKVWHGQMYEFLGPSHCSCPYCQTQHSISIWKQNILAPTFGTTPASGTTQTSGGGLFGATSTSGTTPASGTGLFGSRPASGTTAILRGGLFGATSGTTPASGTGPFGSRPASGATSAFGGGLFGATSTSGTTPASGTGLFGSRPASGTTTAFGGGLFGATSTSGTTPVSGTGLFGSRPASGTTSAFGGGLSGTTPASGTGLFGTTPISGTGLFGSRPASGITPASGTGLSGTTSTPGTTPASETRQFGNKSQSRPSPQQEL